MRKEFVEYQCSVFWHQAIKKFVDVVFFACLDG